MQLCVRACALAGEGQLTVATVKTPENPADTSTGSSCFLCLLESPVSQSWRVLPVDVARMMLEQPGPSLGSVSPPDELPSLTLPVQDLVVVASL